MSTELHVLVLIGVLAGSYVLGSLNSALIISRLFSLPDPRAHGSNNPGATNMWRLNQSRWVPVGTLAGDVGKGVVAVWLAMLVPESPLLAEGLRLEVLAGTLAVVGHVWPVFYGFQGGKGVATLAGVLVMLSPLLLALWLVTWMVVTRLYRLVSAGSIAAAAALPLYAFAAHAEMDMLAMGCFLGVLIVWRHQENLRRLIEGTED